MLANRSEVSPAEVKSSVTAIAVAKGFARAVLTGYDHLFDLNEAHLVNHLTNEGLKSLRGVNWALGASIATLPYSWQQSFFNRWVLPGYDQKVMLRKLMIKQKIEQAIANGAKQVVFLSGGYDIRALVTALDHPDVTVYEIDRGPTRTCKVEGLKNIPNKIGFDFVLLNEESPELAQANHNLFYINADLSLPTWVNVLRDVGFKPQQHTIFIAEGLSMYLEEKDNRQLLDTVKTLMTDESELVISYSTATMYSQLAESVQTSSNELLKFALRQENVINFTQASQFSVTQQFSPAHALQLIGDPNAPYYQGDIDRPLERYYVLTKNAAQPIIDIKQVPDIALTLANKPSVTMAETCNIL